MSAPMEHFSFVGKTAFRVILSTFYTFLLCFTTPTNSVTHVNPKDVLDIYEQSCLVVVTEFALSDTLEMIDDLQKSVFKNENSVLFGSLDTKTFIWLNGERLKLNHQDSKAEVLVFLKKKMDRTCLLSTNARVYPVPVAFRGVSNLQTITDFINNKCHTYLGANGHLNIEGLHREEILKNLFSVSNISDITSDLAARNKIFISKEPFLHKNLSCDKDENLRENDSWKYSNFQSEELTWLMYTKPGVDIHVKLPECEKIQLPHKDDFFHNYLKTSKPVVIKNAIKEWPAFTKWTNQYLKEKYGDQDVHIKLTPGGEYEGVELAEIWDDFPKFKIPDAVKKKLPFPDLVVVRPATMNMKFSKFIDLIENVSKKVVQNISAYLEYSSIPDYLPELEDDIKEMPIFEGILKREHLNIWLSDGNTLGKLHFDAFDNFLCQISGKKQVIMFEPHDNSRLYESHIPEAILSYNKESGEFKRKTLMDSTSMVMSPVDIRHIDFERFPEFSKTYPLNCTIEEGDVLFMPSYWWHEVQSYPNETAGRNLAVNFWYEPFLTKEFPCPECRLDINPKYRHLL